MKKIVSRLLISLIFLALGASAALALSVTGDIIHNILSKYKVENEEDF
ncbi:MAG: hypothetical protein MRK02_05955 [Candidatus Scalindua sp.]|nr:hypothetical protein [Candidatus Scalindua sp.]